MRVYLHLWEQSSAWQTLGGRLQYEVGPHAALGLPPAARAGVIAALYRRWRRPALLITLSREEAETAYSDLLAFFAPPEGREVPVHLFPSLPTLLYEGVERDREVVGQRLAVLEGLLRGEPLLVVTPLSALLHHTLPRDQLAGTDLVLRVGQELAPETLAQRLTELGYQAHDPVLLPGHYSRRGGIVDVFPVTAPHPLRIEFFGDEIESLRTFDVNSQRSLQPQESFTVTVSREALHGRLASPEHLMAIKRALARQERALREAGRDLQAARLRSQVEEDLERLERGEWFDGLEHYLPYLHPEPGTLLDYLPPEGWVFVFDPDRLPERAVQLRTEINEVYRTRVERGALLALPGPPYLPFDPSSPPWQGRPTVLFAAGEPPPEATSAVEFPATKAPAWAGKFDQLVEELLRLRRERWRVVVATYQANRLQQLLTSHRWGDVLLAEEGLVPQPGQVAVVGQPLSGGFYLADIRLAVFTDGEIFGGRKRRRLPTRRLAKRESTALASLTELEVGDLVVHVNHGIGRYMGLVTKNVDGVERDYLAIHYAGTDKLFVPVTQLDRVQKYLGPDDEEPPLDRLSGNRWERTKRRARRSALEVAQELLALYARRQQAEGYAFSPDTDWQQEMEAAFIYEETPDQLRVVQEVKADMERPRPMDRLLCGDVGYGKTEVAIRVAFKAVQDSKQVAVLVPTTVLAQQHYNTFTERLAAYPVVIEMLSRFRTPKEQQDILNRLYAGRVDIVIGTHRLLQDDVRFKDLGLVIIDEEHRFGVRHKERLKQLRLEVDVLTLTATPIPRTLHSALIGIRDLSLLADPPEGRMPVETYILERNEDVVREAILRELERDGQVYVVHNRVRTIHRAAEWVRRLVPQARLAIAHGQLPEYELEQVMFDFYAGRYDVLVCTTIIESGLDIPNVNTLIVDECERLGLAQLYQLRGRVGRSNRQAYAFFLYRPRQTLTAAVEQRLEALQELTELGSGLRLALRDLEIRGAGNLLGPEQHGFLYEVGYEMYTQMLAEAVLRLRGEEIKPRLEVEIDLPVEAYLPEDYIPSAKQRLDLYRRLATATVHEEIDDLAEEMQDRFGRPPEPAQNLLRLLHLKVDGARAGLRAIAFSPGKKSVVAEFLPTRILSPRDMRNFAQALRRTYQHLPGAPLRLQRKRIQVPLRVPTPPAILREAETLVKRLINVEA